MNLQPEEPGAHIERQVDEARTAVTYFVVALLVAAAAVVLCLLVLARLDACPWRFVCGPLLAEDVVQSRLDTALPALQDNSAMEQTFVPNRDGLTEIELILVRYGGEVAAGDPARFTVELWDEAGARVAARTMPTGELDHNETFHLNFAPVDDSAGRRFTLRLRGSETNHISAWGYSLDVYDGGELAQIGAPSNTPLPAARELRFTTRYALTGGEALAAALAPLQQERFLLLAMLLYLPLPGVLLLLLFRPRGWDGAAWLGVALALGIAAWPLVWFWLSLAGGHWTGALLWGATAAGWLVVIVLTAKRYRDNRRRKTGHAPGGRSSPVIYPLLLALLLVASLASRFVAVRDQAYPPWVDSSRHALITAVMADSGQTPDNYEPYLPVDHFPYHFGFHTLSAGLVLMTGRPLPELLLTIGQLLNGLLPLTVYAAGWLVTRRRAVGLLAAFLVALPFFFPGYYATWGRMTQLAAMMVMPVLLALTWRLGRGRPREWPLVGVLAAGLFLIHFRVFVFYLPFATLVGIAHWFGHRRIGALLKAGALALILVLPRFARLLADTNPLQTVGQSFPGYNDFPIGYVTTGWERLYLGAAAAATILLLIATARRRRWVTFPILLLIWVAALFVMLAGDRLGLPETLVINLNSMYITLFLPLSLYLAIVAGESWRQVERWLRRVERRRQPADDGRQITNKNPQPTDDGPQTTPTPVPAPGLADPAPAQPRPLSVDLGKATRVAFGVATGIALGLLALFGWRQQANILNPQTILALPPDQAALQWMGLNLPEDARVAVNAWQWLGVTWAGSDGGAWLTPLTGLEATTPPVDHIYNRDLFAEVRAFNEAASVEEDWGDPAAADWLRDQGVTHVYVGQRGGFFDPAELARNPELALVFKHNGTFVFAVGE